MWPVNGQVGSRIYNVLLLLLDKPHRVRVTERAGCPRTRTELPFFDRRRRVIPNTLLHAAVMRRLFIRLFFRVCTGCVNYRAPGLHSELTARIQALEKKLRVWFSRHKKSAHTQRARARARAPGPEEPVCQLRGDTSVFNNLSTETPTAWAGSNTFTTQSGPANGRDCQTSGKLFTQDQGAELGAGRAAGVCVDGDDERFWIDPRRHGSTMAVDGRLSVRFPHICWNLLWKYKELETRGNKECVCFG